MKSKYLALLAYFIYSSHLAAVLYFGSIDQRKIFDWKYQNETSLGFIIVGLFIYAIAYFKLGVKKSSGLLFSGIILSGIYKYVRHPQMLGWMTFLVGLSLYLDSMAAFLLVFLLWLVYKILLQPREEQKLKIKYGKEYLTYKRNTFSGI